MTENPTNRKIGAGAIAIVVLSIIVLFFSYNLFGTARMVRNGDIMMAGIIAYVGFAITMACGFVLAGRSLAMRTISAVLLISAGVSAFLTGNMMETAQKGLHVNGTFGDAFSIGFATLFWQASGIAMVLLAIAALASSKRQSTPPLKIPIVIFSVIALIIAAGPFAYAYLDEKYLEPASGQASLAEWKDRNPYLATQLEERGLLDEGGRNIVDGRRWYASISGGSWQIEHDDWKIRYNNEHDFWKAVNSTDEDLTIYVYEDSSYGLIGFPDHEEHHRIHVVVDRIDEDSLKEISSFVNDKAPMQGNFKLTDGTLVSYTVPEDQRQQILASYNDRGFPNDASGGFGWTDEHGLEWTVYLDGDDSFASTYIMNDDHATVKHTVIAAQNPDSVIHERNIDIIEVERLDVATLNSLSDQARKLLGH